MRRLLLISLLLPATVHAQATRDGAILVTVTRTTQLAPDGASWFVTIEGTGESSAAAPTTLPTAGAPTGMQTYAPEVRANVTVVARFRLQREGP